jgi:hypothetical protein
MNKLRIVFFLALAAALTTGMMLLASLTSAEYMEWLSGLSSVQAKLVVPLLIALTAVFLALAGYVRSKSSPDTTEEKS